MPLVIVALAGQSAAIGQLQITLRSLQSLDRGLLVHAQHNGLRGRGDIQADNIRGFGRKVRVVALTPGLASREVNLVAAQEPPDILDINIAQRLGQQRAGSTRKPFRWRLVQQLQNPLVGRLRVNRLLARPRLVFQPFKAMDGIAMPPKAYNPRLDPNLLGDRPGAAPGRRQQDYPCPLQIALQCRRRATTRLKHLAIFPRKVDFSCFGNHPDLESRLTFLGKRVLVPRQMSTGDRTILGRLSKRGNGYLRMLFMQAARVILLRPANWSKHGFGAWLVRAAQRLHPNVLAAALANKLARIAWTVLAQERSYQARVTKAAA